MSGTPKWNSSLRTPGPKPAVPLADPPEDDVAARRRAAAAQAEAEAEDHLGAGAPAGVAPDPLAHDSSTDDIISSMNGTAAPRPAAPAHNTAPAPPSLAARALEFVGDYWYLSAPLGVVLLLLLLWTTLFAGGGGEVAPAAESQQPGAPGVPSEQAGAGSAPRDTGIVIDTPVTEAGTYYLSIGADTWSGEATDTQNGEELSLEGATAANFKRAVTLPNGSITTGVFGRAEPDKPIYHATFHRTTLGDEQNPDETTTGTYYAVDGDRIAVQGSYADIRDGDLVTRTYTETKPGETTPNSYSVTFAAPKQVPIPYLVGWQEPDAQAADVQPETAKQPAPEQKEAP